MVRIYEWLRKRNFALACSVFAIVFFSFVAVTPVTVSAGTAGLVPCGDETYPPDARDANNKPVGGTVSNPCDFSHVLALINNIANFFIITGAAVAALAFGYAGFLMMTAAGEMGKIEEAKAIFGKVLVGFLFMLSAWLIVHAIEAAFLDTTNADPTKRFKSLLG
ncbi:MAG: pilin [bacterium]|nr:pilin [bacterium]